MTPPYIIYLLLLSLTGAGALKVTMREPLVKSLRGDSVTIPCDIIELDPGKIVTVTWTRTSNGSTVNVYQYIPGDQKDYRPGSYMVGSDIERGNAALHIPRILFSDNGEYTCNVIVTPNKAEGKSTLQVSAQPSATVTPEEITIEVGTEKSVVCEVSNYYPHPASIRWVRHLKDSKECVVLDRGACSSAPVTNSDGTFNVTSHLTLNPSIEDNGNKYSCMVTHRSLEGELLRNFTLTVTEPESHTGAVVGAVVGTLLSTLLLFSLIFLYLKMCKKDPPSLSAITGNDEMIDMTRTMLTCHIMNFRPNDIDISVGLKRTGQEEKTILTRSSRDTINKTPGEDEELGLMNGSVDQERPLHIQMVLDTQHKRLGTFNCDCRIHITPSIAEDDGAELYLHVNHPALSSPISVHKTLRVTGVAPKLLTIMAPERLVHGEMVTLTCPINGFRPGALNITWLKLDQNNQESVMCNVMCDSNGTTDHDNKYDNKYQHNVKYIKHEDNSYSALSALRMIVNINEDKEVRYICSTNHPATGKTTQEKLCPEIVARPVLDQIQCGQKSFSVGDPVTLSCRIHSFYPEQIEVIWYRRDGSVLPSVTSEVLCEGSSLCYVPSTVTFTPLVTDGGKEIRCEVRHKSLTEPTSVTWTLQNLISLGSISEILCVPECPRVGEDVTLSCKITDMFPKKYEARWHRGGVRCSSGKMTDNFEQDAISKMFNGTIELTFTVKKSDHNAEYRLDVIQSSRTMKKFYTMKVSEAPELSNITSDTDTPSYGSRLTLRCDVTGCQSKDITVDWIQGNDRPLEIRQGTETQVTEEMGAISCVLRIIPTAEDYGKVYKCRVKHENNILVERKTSVSLPGKSPSLSEITVQPVRPGAGKETSFTATISGFSPGDLHVRWYKGFSVFPSDNVITSQLQIGGDSLYICSSTLRFTPQQSDHKTSIRCEVTHLVTKAIREKQHLLLLAGEKDPDGLRDPVRNQPALPQSPRYEILGIECVTVSPRVGAEVTLRCKVAGCNAQDAMFSWYNGVFPLEGEIKNGDLEDSSGSFSTITFTPKESDRDSTIRFQANSNYQTIEKTFTLTLQ